MNRNKLLNHVVVSCMSMIFAKVITIIINLKLQLEVSNTYHHNPYSRDQHKNQEGQTEHQAAL